MSFLRSLFSGVSGLRNHQVMMDVIGNNISNINTVGFKASRTTFSEAFAQTLRSATRPTATNGGANPMQVGLGTAISTIDTIFSQGNLETTGNETDLAIKGNAFFAVNKGGKTYYTRVGTFQFDAEGRLVHPGTGAVLQGKIAAPGGTLPTGTQTEDLKIALDQKSPAKATSEVKFSGNLNATASVAVASLAGNISAATAVGGSVSQTFNVTDDLGVSHTVTATLTKSAADTWDVALSSTDGSITGGTGTATFDPATGRLTSITPAKFSLTPSGSAPAIAFTLDASSLTQVGSSNSLAATLQSPAESTTASVSIFDSLGNRHTLSVKFSKTANANEWSWTADVGTPASITSGRTGRILFNNDGTLSAFTYDDGSSGLSINPNNGAAAVSINLNPGTAGAFAGITQSNAASLVSPREQNGYASGEMSNISIDQTGKILGTFTNGTILTLGQVMLAEFNNPSGLVRSGDNMYDISGNSGTPVIVSAGESSRSTIVSGSLEQSNVDLSEEFTRMITAQRGFQSNARVITTSDEFLNEVVNLKR